MLGAEEVELLAFEIHDADEAVLGDQWNGELRADIGIGRDGKKSTALEASLRRIGWRVSATWPTTPLPTGTRVRSICGVWPI